MEAFFRGSHTTNFVTCGFSKSYNQAAEVPSSKVTCNSPRSPWTKSRIMFALVSITHSITIFPAAFMTAIEILSLCTSMPIYLVLVIRVFLSGGLSQALKTYSKRSALYIASHYRRSGFPDQFHNVRSAVEISGWLDSNRKPRSVEFDSEAHGAYS